MSQSKEFSEEYYKLQSKLSDLGLYEKKMDISEMQQIESTLHESILDQEEKDGAQDLFFTHNSTMISFAENSHSLESFAEKSHSLESGFISHEDCIQNNSSPPSPINSFEKIIVIAEVHHELNYSPKSSKHDITAEKNYEQSQSNKNSDSVNENCIVDSGIFLEPINTPNRRKNLETFFKNVASLK